MINCNMSKSVWIERYQPQTLADVILPDDVRTKFVSFVESGDMPNLGFWSSDPGLGKSSTAKAILNDLGHEALWINASLEKGIDVLRGKIQRFAMQTSIDGLFKVVVMDEVDNLSRDAQAAFRGFIDDYSQNCRFIFTGNYRNKIIEPLQDRLSNFDFASFKRKDIAKPMALRLMAILENEHVSYTKDDLVKIIHTYYPRMRSMITYLQKSCTTGTLVLNENEIDDMSAFDEVLRLLGGRNYVDLIQKINTLTSPDNMYTYIYKNAEQYFSVQELPKVVMTCAKYQNYSSQVRDKHLNLAACLTEIIS